MTEYLKSYSEIDSEVRANVRAMMAAEIDSAERAALRAAGERLSAERREVEKRCFQGPSAEGSALIGRSGSKFHPATRSPLGGVRLTCSCGGTANGFAHNAVRAFYVGRPSDCGTAR